VPPDFSNSQGNKNSTEFTTYRFPVFPLPLRVDRDTPGRELDKKNILWGEHPIAPTRLFVLTFRHGRTTILLQPAVSRGITASAELEPNQNRD
jgi:hypothetical protein